VPDSEHEIAYWPRPSPSISGNADQVALRSVSVQVGPFVVDVLVDEAGRFRGVARVSVESNTPGVGGVRSASPDDVEKYYDVGHTDEH
jgi:hypothetical protein